MEVENNQNFNHKKEGDEHNYQEDFENPGTYGGTNKGTKTVYNKSLNLLSNKKKAKGFRAFNLIENLYEAIKRIGYKFPTPIQRRTIPDIVSGVNVIAHSRTGSGKTAAFLIPILNRLKEHSKIVGTRCLIVSPTRELAHQTLSFCKKLGKFTDLRYTLLVGGNELEGQFEKLAQNPDIIIATPGRIVHHLQEGSLSLKKIEILAIDEADKIFELNFEEQIKYILKSCPSNRQVLLFSATIPQQLATFMKTGIREYKLINIDEESKIPEKLKIHVITTRTEEKKYALVSLLTKNSLINRNESTLIFVATKYHCEFLHEFLKLWKIQTLFIYGQMDQDLRDANLLKFRKKQVSIMLVTDVAARGLDIPMLDNVINYDFPDTIKLFIHRIGRTARAGRDGKVFNLITSTDLAFFFDFKVNLGKKLTLHKEFNTQVISQDLNDCSTVSFGSVPQLILNQVKETREDFLNNKIDLEGLESTSIKAMEKAASFKQKPSNYGIKQAKKLVQLHSIQPHPIYLKFFDKNKIQDEIEKADFLTQLKNFKPKESYFERVNETNVKEEVIKDFKSKANEYKRKKELEKKKEKFEREKIQNAQDEEQDEEKDEGYSENDSDQENESKLQQKKKEENYRKLDSILNDENTNEFQKDFLGKKVKRSKMKNFKNNPHYISETKATGTSSNSLWGDEKPLSLDELTLNINPDDDNLNQKKKLVWDPKKKNFVKSQVDKHGKIIKTNEAGVKIKSKDKNPNNYKSWKKKNKLRVQSVGEMENEKISGNAESMFKERKMKKQMKNNLKNMNKNESGRKPQNEVKSFDQLLKAKKEKFKKQSRKQFSKRDAKERQIQERSHLNRKSMSLVKRRKK